MLFFNFAFLFYFLCDWNVFAIVLMTSECTRVSAGYRPRWHTTNELSSECYSNRTDAHYLSLSPVFTDDPDQPNTAGELRQRVRANTASPESR